jgi:hypothetical protein
MAGRLLGLFANLRIFPTVASAVAWVFLDKLSPFVNNIPYFPKDAINTLVNLKLLFLAGVFMFVLIICWNHMVQSQNRSDMVS